MMKRLSVLLLVGTFSLGVHAQAPEVAFEQLTMADGLSYSVVRDILQDRQGYLWLATPTGLNRYDGYTFSIYQQSPDSTSLSDDDIISLAEDREGVLWIGTWTGGLNRFDRATEIFTHYRHQANDPASLSSDSVSVVLVDRDNVLWVGTEDGGLNRFHRATGSFTRYQFDLDNPQSLSHNQVHTLYEDQQGILWVGTGGGLNRFDPQTASFTRFVHDANDPNSLADNRVTLIQEDRQGLLYIGTCGNSLYRFDQDHNRVERLSIVFQSLLDDTGFSGSFFVHDIRCDRIGVFYEGDDGTVWVGTTRRGLFRFDSMQAVLQHGADAPDDLQAVYDARVDGVIKDRHGTLWFAGFLVGALRVVRPAGTFQHLPFHPGGLDLQNATVTAVIEDREGVLWMGSNGEGLATLDRTRGITKNYRGAPDGAGNLSGDWIRALLEDREGTIWVGTYEAGLYRWDAETVHFIHYPLDPTNPDALHGIDTNALLDDHEGILWVGTNGGLHRFDREREVFRHDPDDPGSLSHDDVDVLYEDRQGTLWVGTWGNGINRFDRATERYDAYLPSTRVNAIYEDKAGRFWVGTETGLFLFDRDDGSSTWFTQEHGLPTSIILSILDDAAGHLWLGTPNGLVKFDVEAQTFIRFSTVEGLGQNGFLQAGAYKSKQGEMFFGGENGLTAFFPEAFTHDPNPPAVLLSGIKIFDKPLVPNPEGPLQQPLSETEAITLAHGQNNIAFDYVALHYKDSRRNQYRYRLVPVDAGWVEAGTQRTARYPQLSPGDYVFQVKASNSDGVWNAEGMSLQITILPPWWRTPWAYLGYVVLFLSGVFAADRFQRRRLIRREREKAKERELEQAREIEKAHLALQQSHEHLKATQVQLVQQEKMASLGALTAGIAHEIKNPLNFVNNFAEVNEELADELREALDEGNLEEARALLADLKQNARVINQHGKRADGIVHAMMQHASGGSGQREATDINALVNEYIDLAYHGKRAQVPDLQVEIERDLDADAGTVEVVPQEIGRVLLNLLGNAFDAVHEKVDAERGRRGDTETGYTPTVTVTTRRNGEAVAIRISDNGPGIHKDFLQKIFEPFFTTKPTGSGTGLGLSLSYDIVTQGHGGTLTVESNEGEGATFVIVLSHA